MKTYHLTLSLKVEVEAFGPDDALEAVEDIFGPGDTAGLTVTNLKVQEIAEL